MTLLERLQRTGIRRLGTKKSGFRYRTAEGRRPSPADLGRIHALRLPPAWTDVYIHPSPRGHLQSMGRDAAGRWQYRYHPDFARRQAERKYQRLTDFARALPKLRRRVDRDLRRPGMGREKVMACILEILSDCFIRPGSQAYAAENGSYGLATLRNEHVRVHGDTVHFSFPGKSGKHQERTLHDARVARIVRRLERMPGVELFKFVDGDGNVVDVKRRHINGYIKEVMGDRFSAKDFRTWAGTLIAASALARAGVDPSDSKTARKKKVVQAVKEAASVLGNTPAICRASYIYPSVLSSFERGRTVVHHLEDVEELARHRAPSLHPSEAALLALLEEDGKAPRPSARRRSRPRRQAPAQTHRTGRSRRRPAARPAV